jgi:hypothetical protein
MGPLCPSAQPDMEDARIFGVLSGTAAEPRIAYLEAGVAVDAEVAGRTGDLAPTQLFRFAAKCEERRCSHFDGARCSLAERVVALLPVVVEMLPRCQIRVGCRWFAEQGGDACKRCPQVVTMIPKDDDALNKAAMPTDAPA